MSRIKYYNTTTQEWEYADGLSGGGIPEAPADGKQYARKDGAWAEVQCGGGTGLTQTEKNNLLTILDAVIVETAKQDAANAALEALRILWQGGQVIVTQEGSTLVFSGVSPITSVVQIGTKLILT